MKQQTHARSPQQPQNQHPGKGEEKAGESQADFVDNRESAIAQTKMADAMALSPLGLTQQAWGQRINNNPGTTTQRRQTMWFAGTSSPSAVQRVSDRKLKTAITKAGFTLETVDTWQGKAKLSDSQIGELLTADLLGVALGLAPAKVGANADDLIGWVGAQKANQERQAEASNVVVKPKTMVDELEEGGVSPIFGAVLAKRETKSDLRVILGQNPPGMAEILQCAAARQNTLKSVQDLLVTNTSNQGYGQTQVLSWASGHGAVETDAALVATAHEKNVAYVTNWLAYAVTAASAIQLRQLVRFQALLAGGAQLVREKADTRYQGKNEERTGFLKYAFSDGSVMKIHTHWNVTAKQIVSMHIQDLAGSNGLEINTWTFFANVAAEVLAGQNRSSPTTVPIGGSLSL